MPGKRWVSGVADTDVGVLGASSLVGEYLLVSLVENSYRVTAYSRKVNAHTGDRVEWKLLSDFALLSSQFASHELGTNIALWICVAPIWVLPAYFHLLEAHGARRVVALSSTSRYTKGRSSDLQERTVARRLVMAEADVQCWAEKRGVEWVILRPTLIYGRGRDKNIAEIAGFIRRYGFFPIFGRALGLRQPVHAEDVATACVGALESSNAKCRAYNITGGETIAYRDMVTRVFTALGRPPRLLPLPMWTFRAGVMAIRLLPRYRHWSAVMAERMNSDLVFDSNDTKLDFPFNPRAFQLTDEDVSA